MATIQQQRALDLNAARHMLTVHFTKLNKAVDQADYPDCCAALRAIQEECENAGRIAANLSLNSHLTNTRR